MQTETKPKRVVLSVGGSDRLKFLQGLVTNDVDKAAQSLVYAALLTPQGKYLADFFLTAGENSVLLDVDGALAGPLAQRLSIYKLRADVSITDSGLHAVRGLGDPPADGLADPRHPALGWRAYRKKDEPDSIDWDEIRVAHVIPESGVELVPNESYILECGFERLHGVDFTKGCYVGQEVTARMKHKAVLRKGLLQVSVSQAVSPGTPIMAGGKPVGQIHTVSGNNAIAYLRLDRAKSGPMDAGGASLTVNEKV